MGDTGKGDASGRIPVIRFSNPAGCFCASELLLRGSPPAPRASSLRLSSSSQILLEKCPCSFVMRDNAAALSSPTSKEFSLLFADGSLVRTHLERPSPALGDCTPRPIPKDLPSYLSGVLAKKACLGKHFLYRPTTTSNTKRFEFGARATRRRDASQ